MKKKLFIISSEKIYHSDEKDFFCDNIDMKSTPEKLDDFFDVNILAKKTNKNRSLKIKLKSINTSGNILKYLNEIIKTKKDSNSKYLIISISPYTFLASLVLRILRKETYIYLRSNGFEEYRILLGITGYITYFLMFSITSRISNFICCNKHLLRGKKGYVVRPSQIDSDWKANLSTPEINETKLLYVGRVRKEKGIFSLIKILEEKNDIKFTIVGQEKDTNIEIKNKNIKILKIINEKNDLIKIYDQHNIFILPSFTEGHPMVLLEALSRLRPVIIFNEIRHVVGNYKGVFIADRNISSIIQKTDYIKKNYKKIQEEMRENQIPNNYDFIKDICKILTN